jgi:type IV secretory pathway VirB10-like protein
VELDHETAGDAQGYAGLADQVDRHWRRLLGASLISGLLGVTSELGAGRGDDQILQALRTGVASAANQAGQQLVGKSLEVAPSISIRPGYPVRVFLTRDLVLEPWRS